MSIVFLVVGVLLVAYLTLLLTMPPDAGATGGVSGIEPSNGKASKSEISNGKGSDDEVLHPDGELIRKEQFKRH